MRRGGEDKTSVSMGELRCKHANCRSKKDSVPKAANHYKQAQDQKDLRTNSEVHQNMSYEH